MYAYRSKGRTTPTTRQEEVKEDGLPQEEGREEDVPEEGGQGEGGRTVRRRLLKVNIIKHQRYSYR